MTTKIKPSVLADTAVSAGTYGGTTQHAVYTVDQQGRITYATNATPSIANTQITGLITSGQIATVANTQVTGLITSAQIATVANTQVTGLITSGQIATVANTQISGVITATQVANSQTYAINTSGSANSISSGSWTITQSGTKLNFAYGGTTVFSIDSTGNIIAKADVSGFGTP